MKHRLQYYHFLHLSSVMLLVMSLFLCACQKDNPPNVDTGYQYFPTEEGKYVLYKVMEVRHDTDLSPVHDTSHYYIKETIGESYIDEMGDTAHKLYRFHGDHPDSLSMKDVWTIKRTNTNAQKVAENIRYIKLGFAPNLDIEWDGNAMNNLEEKIYSYDWINQPFTINSQNFSSSVKINQIDFYTFVDYLKAYEVYAEDVGLIQKIDKNFYIENFDTINVIKGNEIKMEAIDYGTE